MLLLASMAGEGLSPIKGSAYKLKWVEFAKSYYNFNWNAVLRFDEKGVFGNTHSRRAKSRTQNEHVHKIIKSSGSGSFVKTQVYLLVRCIFNEKICSVFIFRVRSCLQ